MKPGTYVIDAIFRRWKRAEARDDVRRAYELGQLILAWLNKKGAPPTWTPEEHQKFVSWACKNIALKDPPR